jgi:hypothetical protein
MAIARIGSHVETNGEGVGSAAGWVVTGLRTVVVVVVLVVRGSGGRRHMAPCSRMSPVGPVGPYPFVIAAYLAVPENSTAHPR